MSSSICTHDEIIAPTYGNPFARPRQAPVLPRRRSHQPALAQPAAAPAKRRWVVPARVKRWIGVALVVVAAAMVAATLVFTRSDEEPELEITLALPAQIARPDPLRFEPGRSEEYEQAAAFGLSHVLFEKSPGGVLRAAERTASFRDLVDEATSSTGVDPDVVEAIVLLESAGRQDVIAGDDPANAAGLTQILAASGASKLYAVTVKSTQLSSGFTHLAPRLTVGGSSAAMLTSINAIQYNLRTGPASNNGLTQDVLLVA